jgi:hypothetical protein
MMRFSSNKKISEPNGRIRVINGLGNYLEGGLEK